MYRVKFFHPRQTSSPVELVSFETIPELENSRSKERFAPLSLIKFDEEAFIPPLSH